jgi:hypothetical protein
VKLHEIPGYKDYLLRVSVLLASFRKDHSRTSYAVITILGEVRVITAINIFLFEIITELI